MISEARTEGAWVICPSNAVKPVQLVRVIEGWDSVDDEDLVDSCVPMDGSIQAFFEAGRSWEEKYGGHFTGYASVEDFVTDIFHFDPLLGCWRVASGMTARCLWPVTLDDLYELTDMGPSWCEAMARILASVPAERRGRAIMRVPDGLRQQFAIWCRAAVGSGALDGCVIRGTGSFRRVIRECAGERASCATSPA